MTTTDRGSIQFNANGRFERWVMGIVATLIGVGVVAMIVLAIQVGQVANDMGWVKSILVDVRAAVNDNDRRLDKLEAGR